MELLAKAQCIINDILCYIEKDNNFQRDAKDKPQVNVLCNTAALDDIEQIYDNDAEHSLDIE